MITLAKANGMIRACLKHANEMRLKPLTIAVLDAGGHLKALQRQDGTSILRPGIAHGKAHGALAMGMGSRALNKVALERPHFISAIATLAGGALVPVPGGVLVRNRKGAIIGAVGISGDTSDKDELCAKAGIVAVGLIADTG